jgi:hypothetical protein
MRRLWITLLLAIALLGFSYHASLAISGDLQDYATQVDYTFGGQVNFRLQLSPDTPVQEVQIFIRSQGDSETYLGTATLSPEEAIYIHDLTSQPLRAFAEVQYWFQVTTQAGEVYTTPPQAFFYEDNRFAWQVLDSSPFTVHWYEGDLAFGQSVLDAAQEGLSRAQSLLPLPPPEPIDIYVYASGAEMQSTLRLGGLKWVAGHADPDLGVMVVSLPAGPDQHRETERQIPHELMHILTYQSVGSVYSDLPVWFKEGTASANELRPNPDYYIILTKAAESDTLIPLSYLCASFPQDTSLYLAYAESDSFIRYLYQVYGSAGLGAMLQSYAEGQGCENGSQVALGEDLAQLERQWQREALGTEAVLAALENLLPWFLLLLIVISVPLLLTLLSLRKKKPTSSPSPSP